MLEPMGRGERAKAGVVERPRGRRVAADAADPLVYAPEADAPEEGEFVMEDGPFGPAAVRWRQAHQRLVCDALRSWKGAPATMRIQIQAERAGEPQPWSGSGKQMRAQAAALLWELAEKARPTPRLWRGAEFEPGDELQPWSERKSVARGFAGKQGQLYELPAGSARGIRIADYIGDSMMEHEWILIA